MSQSDNYQPVCLNTDVRVRTRLVLAGQQIPELTAITQSRSLPAGYVFGAKLILVLTEGASFNTITRQRHTSAPRSFAGEGLLVNGVEGLIPAIRVRGAPCCPPPCA